MDSFTHSYYASNVLSIFFQLEHFDFSTLGTKKHRWSAHSFRSSAKKEVSKKFYTLRLRVSFFPASNFRLNMQIYYSLAVENFSTGLHENKLLPAWKTIDTVHAWKTIDTVHAWKTIDTVPTWKIINTYVKNNSKFGAIIVFHVVNLIFFQEWADICLNEIKLNASEKKYIPAWKIINTAWKIINTAWKIFNAAWKIIASEKK